MRPKRCRRPSRRDSSRRGLVVGPDQGKSSPHGPEGRPGCPEMTVTSQYAAYGAGMSLCDGYFLDQRFHKVNLEDRSAVIKAFDEYEAYQLAHTTSQADHTYFMGRLFHHIAFPLTVLRDVVLGWTPFLQRQAGECSPQDIIAQLKLMGPRIEP